MKPKGCLSQIIRATLWVCRVMYYPGPNKKQECPQTWLNEGGWETPDPEVKAPGESLYSHWSASAFHFHALGPTSVNSLSAIDTRIKTSSETQWPCSEGTALFVLKLCQASLAFVLVLHLHGALWGLSPWDSNRKFISTQSVVSWPCGLDLRNVVSVLLRCRPQTVPRLRS